MEPITPEWLELSYARFPDVEDRFHAALDRSLGPRGPEVLYEIVGGLGLEPGAVAVDVGCGEGRHALELARRFGLAVVGIDPVPRHLELSTAALAEEPGLQPRVMLLPGTAEDLPVDDCSAALVWCRDVLSHVTDLDRAYREIHRVLRPDGYALVYQMFGTERLEPREAAWLFQTMGVVPAGARPESAESALAAAGLRVERRIEIGSDWGELAEEESGKPGRRLLWAARLLRAPERYLAEFGEEMYGLMLGDCLWHVYAMIGKLERRAYLLKKR